MQFSEHVFWASRFVVLSVSALNNTLNKSLPANISQIIQKFKGNIPPSHHQRSCTCFMVHRGDSIPPMAPRTHRASPCFMRCPTLRWDTSHSSASQVWLLLVIWSKRNQHAG